MQIAEDAESLLVDGLVATTISREKSDRPGQRFGYGRWIFRTTKSESRGPVEGGPSIRTEELVARLVPSTSENVTSVANWICNPFFDIPRHVVISIRRQTAVQPNTCRALASKVADAQNVGIEKTTCSAVPVINGREALLRELGVCCRFVPADATHRKICLSFREVSELPGGRARPARGIAEVRHGLFPGKDTPIPHERLFPVLLFLVSSRIHKLFELAVCHFIFVQPKLRNCRQKGRQQGVSCLARG